MKVTLHLYDELRDLLGQRRLVVSLPAGATLGDLFAQLAREVDPRFAALPNDDRSPFGVNVLVLEGRRIELPRDAGRPLRDGDELHLIPPIAGG